MQIQQIDIAPSKSILAASGIKMENSKKSFTSYFKNSLQVVHITGNDTVIFRIELYKSIIGNLDS